MNHPYADLPDQAFWRRAVAEQGPGLLPVAGDFLRLNRQDKVMTAGSCFAQHIGRHLAAAGHNYLVTEHAHPVIPPEVAHAAGYGVFTARYGNVYTTRQLVQLIDRAYGRFVPTEPSWEGPDGTLIDPFRPTIQPGGFGSEEELAADRARHFAFVREALESLDVLVFTLGLTETWVSRKDGAAFPLCPGVAGGTFDPARHAFVNLRAAAVRADLGGAIARLRAVNPGARVLLTVSPVPLTATASGNHVLAATTYSKSVLRAAAQETAEDLPDVHYFPSYEIITGPQAGGRFFAPNLREVTPEGVAQVMSTFLRATTGADAGAVAQASSPPADVERTAIAGWVEAMCDEAMLDRPADAR